MLAMRPIIDRTGQRFGRLVALHRADDQCWMWQCDCGATKAIRAQAVVSGLVKSCGCLHLELCRAGKNQTRHGDAKVGQVTRLHSIWRGMHKRCKPTSNAICIERYAARGITVCSEWQDYSAFKEWALANGYADNLSIDRKDNELGYSPGNCQWSDRKTQARNRRTSRYETINGRTQTLAAWSEETGVKASVINTRLNRGWSVERAITTPTKVIAKTW